MYIFFDSGTFRFYELKERYQQVIKYIFKSVKENSIIKIKKYGDRPGVYAISKGKTQKIISYHETLRISIRQYTVREFCNYLECIGVPKSVIVAIKLYHYGDGTIDGNSLKESLKRNELCKVYKNEIALVNKYFSRKSKSKLVFRHFFVNVEDKEVKYFIVNSPGESLVIERKELMDLLFENEYCNSTFMHIGPINYGPAHREALNVSYDKYYRSICSLSFNLGMYLRNKKD